MLSKFEEQVVNACLNSIEDFKKGIIEIEQDQRACMYHHLRSSFDNKNIKILCDKSLEFKRYQTRPDLLIMKGTDNLCAIELKLKSRIDPMREDRRRLKSFKNNIQKTFFIHFDGSSILEFPKLADWQNNYYHEIRYNIRKDITEHFYVKKQRVYESIID